MHLPPAFHLSASFCMHVAWRLDWSLLGLFGQVHASLLLFSGRHDVHSSHIKLLPRSQTIDLARYCQMTPEKQPQDPAIIGPVHASTLADSQPLTYWTSSNHHGHRISLASLVQPQLARPPYLSLPPIIPPNINPPLAFSHSVASVLSPSLASPCQPASILPSVSSRARARVTDVLAIPPPSITHDGSESRPFSH